MAKKRDEADWVERKARRDAGLAALAEPMRRHVLEAALQRQHVQLERRNSPDEYLRQALKAIDVELCGAVVEEESARLLATTREQCLDDLRVALKTPREWRAAYQACVSRAASVATGISITAEDACMAADELVFAAGIAEEREVDPGRTSDMWTEIGKQAKLAESLALGPSINDWRAECHWLSVAKRPEIAKDPIAVDGHLDYVDTVERARDPERAAAMEQALALARESARAGEKLSYDVLARWQAVAVPGLTIAPDSRSAFVDMAPERRGLVKKPEQHFDAALVTRLGAKEPLAWRVCGLCLDIVSFRPFKDGNRRAARLAVDYLLTREGFGLRTVRPLFTRKRPWDQFHLRDAMPAAMGRLPSR